MSDEELNGVPRYIGTIAGWDQITTEYPAGSYPRQEHNFTLPDLLALLKEIKSHLDSKKIEELEKLITDHIARTDNPHHVTLEKLKTSVLQELYKLWLAKGNTGDENQFLKVIFQYVRIADLPITYEGLARDYVPSVYGMAKYVDRHDHDPEAHDPLISRLLPGAPMYTEPTFSAFGYCGMPEHVEIKRNSNLYYIDQTGRIVASGIDELPCDYTFGTGMFPVFGKHTGYINGNADPNLFLASNCVSTNITTSILDLDSNLSDLPFQSKLIRLVGKSDTGPVKHSLKYTHPSVTYTAGEYYTVSMILRVNRKDTTGSNVRIGLPGVFTAPYSYMNFNLHENKTFKNDSVPDTSLIGSICKLHNDCFRVSLTFKTVNTVPMSFEIIPLDILNGDDNYKGANESLFDVIYPQITNTSYLTPLLINNQNTPPILEATKLSLKLDQLYLNGFNPLEGTISVATVPPIGIDSKTTRYLYELADSSNNTIVSGRFTTTHKQRLYSVYNTLGGTSIGTKYTNYHNDAYDTTTFVHSYRKNEQTIGSTYQAAENIRHIPNLNLQGTKLYIGINRYLDAVSILNGYISSIQYYPIHSNIDQINFLVGGHK